MKLYDSFTLTLDVFALTFFAILIWIFGKESLLFVWKRSIVQRKIPGPLALPLLGTRWMYNGFGGYSFNRLHEQYAVLFKKYGSIVKEETLFNIPIISIKDKDDIEKVLKSSGKYPLRPPTEAILYYRKRRPDRYASGGLVNEQGITWHNLRNSLTTELTSTHTIANFVPQIEQIVSDWCDLLKLKSNVDDLKPLAIRLGLEMTCALILDRRMGFLELEEFSTNAQCLYDAVHHHFLACRDTYYGLPLWKLWITPAYAQLTKSEDAIYTLVNELIEGVHDDILGNSVFQNILKAPIDHREKTAAIVDFIAAGIYTLANTVVFLLHLIGSHQDCQKKLHNDISAGSINYARACINENFRLIPTAFCLARISEKNLKLSGYNVAAGSVILCHTGLACRDDNNFDNAQDFAPERWLDSRKTKSITTATFLLAPFGVGRRICPGRRFIEQVLCSLLVGVVQQYNVVALGKLELDFEFILAPRGPVPMMFEERLV